MLTVLVKILGIFAIIVVGYIATKLKVLSHEAEPAMVNLLIMITTPCMIFSSIVTKELDDSISGKVTLILISAFAYFIIMALVVLWLYRRNYRYLLAAGIALAILLGHSLWVDFRTPRRGLIVFNSFSSTPLLYYDDGQDTSGFLMRKILTL